MRVVLMTRVSRNQQLPGVVDVMLVTRQSRHGEGRLDAHCSQDDLHIRKQCLGEDPHTCLLVGYQHAQSQV
jgi:hypothetical protein